MAADKSRAMTQLNDITECCICLKTFTDPRMLPCIHTFCFQCLQDIAEKSDKKPGDQVPCPVCRKEFAIPSKGVQGVQKNFFMAGFIEVRNAFNQPNLDLPCDICKANNDGTEGKIPEATNRCLDCQQNQCEDCHTKHTSSKMSKNHKMVQLGKEVPVEEAVKSLQVMNCDVHHGKVLDYYCADCKKVLCGSCLLESHRLHDCKDVNTVDEEFRKSIQRNGRIISTLSVELLGRRKKMESKEGFLEKIAKREMEILVRSKELKDMIDEHTKSLLGSLDEIKNRHLKEIQMKEEELERRFTILESFLRYCDEVISKGSASEVCRCKDELLTRADELEEDHETYIMRPSVSFDVTFQATESVNFLKTTNGNIIGSVNDNVEQLEDIGSVIGGVLDTSQLIQRSLAMCMSKCAAVYNNSMYVTGIGEMLSEIWKYSFASDWNKCGSLIQGREGHCVTFIDDTLYICGGIANAIVLDNIEAYNTLTEKGTAVGQLINGSVLAACVAYKGSVYAFGGLDKDGKQLDCVQVFSSVDKTCTLLSTPLPRPLTFTRALVWETYALFLDSEACLILNMNEDIWQEPQQFPTNAFATRFILSDGRLFVNESGNMDNNWKDEAKYVRVSSIVNNEAMKWRTEPHPPKSFGFIAAANKLLNPNIYRSIAGEDPVREKNCTVS